MGKRIVAEFDVTGWDQTSSSGENARPAFGEATVSKTYRGDLAGEGKARLLMCQADPADRGQGAGYVASERIRGRLGDREGTFVIQHWGVTGDGPPRTGGHVVPGSGTGQLKGLTGHVEIAVDETGKHTLTLDYEIGQD